MTADEGARRHRRSPPRVHFGIPIKGFASAKSRLAGVVDPTRRRRLATEVAHRVVDAVRRAGFDPVVVTGSNEVKQWARSIGVAWLDEPDGAGLNAASALVASRGSPWCVLHGDLPLIAPTDLIGVADLLESGRAVLAPSRDGGTNLLGASDPITFAYGPGSFARHLAAVSGSRPAVLVTIGLAVELDTIADLRAAARLPGGEWLSSYVP
jgi:2-phospho-L-lactate/phosphoenolpyruvate guanylyltransferase